MKYLTKLAIIFSLATSSCVTVHSSIFRPDAELSVAERDQWDASIKSYKKRLSVDLLDYRKALVSNSSTKPMMWKIEKSGHHTSYLFGTIHTGISWSSFPLSIKNCVNQSQMIVFESIDSVEFDSQTKKNVRKLQMKDGEQGLSKTVGGKAWQNYRNEMLIINNKYLESLAPRSAKNLFFDIKDQFVRGELPQLDLEILEHAKQHHKNVSPLDSKEDLLLVVNNLLSHVKTYSLAEFKKEFESDPYLIYRDYVKEQYVLEYKYKFAQLEEIEKSVSTMPNYDLIIGHRNQNWMPKILAHTQQHHTFFVVGVGHMTGKDSLINKLNAQGFKISRTDECTTL